MRDVTPRVFLVSKPNVQWAELMEYLHLIGAPNWPGEHDQRGSGGATLTEVMGRLCYRSWEPGLNPNVMRVRQDQSEYLANVLNSAHGSVLEHAWYSFIIAYGSRVFTHELVRHRAGTAFSQESMRFVRLDNLDFWQPDWAKNDGELQDRNWEVLTVLESHQKWMAEHFGLDDEGVPFAEKKAKTSYMRRFAPDGVATHIGFSANVRALRWITQLRTALGAEEEIRLIIDQLADRMQMLEPVLFMDFEVDEDGQWVPINRKI